MKAKYAFLMMGEAYIPEQHCATFELDQEINYICTVRDFEEAKEKVKDLVADGVGAIELCGAFEKEQADILMKMTEQKIALGYSTHDPVLDDVYDAFYG